jgi:hypothetical protein
MTENYYNKNVTEVNLSCKESEQPPNKKRSGRESNSPESVFLNV